MLIKYLVAFFNVLVFCYSPLHTGTESKVSRGLCNSRHARYCAPERSNLPSFRFNPVSN